MVLDITQLVKWNHLNAVHVFFVNFWSKSKSKLTMIQNTFKTSQWGEYFYSHCMYLTFCYTYFLSVCYSGLSCKRDFCLSEIVWSIRFCIHFTHWDKILTKKTSSSSSSCFIRTFLQAGKHVCVEYPMTLNYKAAVELWDLAQKKG